MKVEAKPKKKFNKFQQKIKSLWLFRSNVEHDLFGCKIPQFFQPWNTKYISQNKL